MKYIVILLTGFYLFPITTNAQDPGAPPPQVSQSTLYDEGLALKEQKKVSLAAQKFLEATKLNPNHLDAWYELGWCRNDLKDYKGAIQALRHVMPGKKDTYKANFELGYAFEKTEGYDSAKYYYNRAIAINPENANVYKQMGYIAYQVEDYAKALEYFASYEQRYKNPLQDYLYWYRKGFMQNALKDFAAAKISLNKSLEIKIDYTNTYLELGFASSRLKENDQAISYYQQAIERDPKSHVGYNGIGEVYRDNIKNIDVAMSWYQKALDINPDERKANFGMGYCLNSKERFSEAIPYLKKAIQMENTYTAAYVELGYSYYKTSNYSDALTNLNKGISLTPKNENARYYMGLIYIKQNDKPNAQRMVTELKSLNSKNAASLESLVNKM